MTTYPPPEVAVLINHAVRLGADRRIVQGAGGNFSVKVAGVLWIKASGTRLVEAADRPIFVALDEARTRDAVLVTESLGDLVLPDQPAGLRPSIETALHVLLPHRYVFHVHGIGSIAAGIGHEVDAVAATLPGSYDTVVIPYAKPGIELARAVLDSELPAHHAGRALVLLLRNHGLVVGADDADTAVAVLNEVEEHFRDAAAPVELPPSRPSRSMDGYRLLLGAGAVGAVAAEVLCTGALTPDSAVFMGPRPFSRILASGASSGSTNPTSPAQDHRAALIDDDGSVFIRDDLGPDEREIAVSLVDVAGQRVASVPVSALSADDVSVLVNWEAEAWRRQLKR